MIEVHHVKYQVLLKFDHLYLVRLDFFYYQMVNYRYYVDIVVVVGLDDVANGRLVTIKRALDEVGVAGRSRRGLG